MARELRIVADRWLPGGEAVVESEGPRPLVVWGGIPGERCTATLQHQGHNRSYAAWTRSNDPHPGRVVPRCEKYASCGGCAWMHLSPPAQQRAHQQVMRAALDSEGLQSIPVGSVHAADAAWDFRHVVKVAVGRSDRGRIRLGAWGRGGRDIVPIPNCPVAAPVLRRVMSSLAFHVIDLDIWPYEPLTERGVLRSVVLRASSTTGQVLITIVAGQQSPRLRDLAEALAEAVSEIAGIWLHINGDEGNAIFWRDEEGRIPTMRLAGKECIEENIGGTRYRIGAADFFQTHPQVGGILYRRVLERLPLTRGAPFVDLYCGVGGLALQAARHSGRVIGVEESAGAVERARDAAQLNGLSAEFLAGRVEDVLPTLARRLGNTRPVVVVNPARSGLEPSVIEGLKALRPRALAYVSCSPSSLARDLRPLRALGRVEEIELFEMFPHTPHVEALAVVTSEELDQSEKRAPRRRVVR